METFHILFFILLVATSSFFISKKVKSRTGKALIILLPSIILTPILYFLSIFWIADIAKSVKFEKFDKEKWITKKASRYQYSADIDTSSLISNKTTSEIIGLFGEPDVKKGFLFQYNLSKGSWRNKYGFNPWMNIEFQNDTVFKHYTVWDD